MHIYISVKPRHNTDAESSPWFGKGEEKKKEKKEKKIVYQLVDVELIGLDSKH